MTVSELLFSEQADLMLTQLEADPSRTMRVGRIHVALDSLEVDPGAASCRRRRSVIPAPWWHANVEGVADAYRPLHRFSNYAAPTTRFRGMVSGYGRRSLEVTDQRGRRELDVVTAPQRIFDLGEMPHNHGEERLVAQVADPNMEKPTWPAPQQMRVSEVAVLGHHDPIFMVGDGHDVFVRCRISVEKFTGVPSVVPGSDHCRRQSVGQLGVDQESHAASSGSACPPANAAANSRAARRSSRCRSS